MTLGPDFIGIGMERGGSSWIFTMLAAHPDVWVPPIKELHYFDSIDAASPFPKNWRWRRHVPARIKAKLSPFLKELQSRPQLFKNTYLEYLDWDLRYFSGAYSHAWYRSLFDARYTKGRISGEITAAYSTLAEPVIQDLSINFPKAKIILSVREPVSRTVSGLIHYIRGVQGKKLEECSEKEMLSWLKGPVAQQRSNASEILQRWSKYIAPENFWVIDFSDISSTPQAIVEKLYGFIGLDILKAPPATKQKEKIFSFKTGNDNLPPSVLRAIEALHAPEIERMQSYYPDLTKNWGVA